MFHDGRTAKFGENLRTPKPERRLIKADEALDVNYNFVISENLEEKVVGVGSHLSFSLFLKSFETRRILV